MSPFIILRLGHELKPSNLVVKRRGKQLLIFLRFFSNFWIPEKYLKGYTSYNGMCFRGVEDYVEVRGKVRGKVREAIKFLLCRLEKTRASSLDLQRHHVKRSLRQVAFQLPSYDLFFELNSEW